MSYQAMQFFPHRRRKDGTFQSLCLKCLATVGIRGSEDALAELESAHRCGAISSLEENKMTIPARTNLRANISKLEDDDSRYAVHLIAEKDELYLRKTFGSWSDAERCIANLHLSKPFADDAATRFAMGHIQYGDFVENLQPIEPELLGFQIGA
jgi:hypothetical protein